MTTIVDVWNMALGRVAEGTVVIAETEPSTPAKTCKRFWAIARDTTLELFDWSCARVTRRTAELAGADAAPWRIGYQLPSDCLAVRRLLRHARDRDPVEYEIQSHLDGADQQKRIVVTDTKVELLVYTRRVVQPVLWTPLLTDAVAWRLAMDLAPLLPDSRATRKDCWQAWQETLAMAAASVARQRFREEPESELIRARA